MSEKSSVILFCMIVLVSAKSHPPPDCDSMIYCDGPVLLNIQTKLVREFINSAYFVNMKLKNAPDVIFDEFFLIDDKVKPETYLDNLRKYINRNFEPDTAVRSILSDLDKIPNLEESISNEDYRKFASAINEMWPALSVKTSEDVKINKDRHSLIHLPNGYIKSDQFSSTMEYWETYYAFRGLLVNKMYDTALQIILNFGYLINKYGFVLQSNRVYFSRRTQAPMLGLMMENYFVAAGDDAGILKKVLPMMEVEFLWWYNNRLVSVDKNNKQYYLFRYDHESGYPRPEEFKIDYILASKFETKLEEDFSIDNGHKIVEEQDFYFSASHSLSESGLGFTSRFNRKNLRTNDNSNDLSFNRLNTDVKNFIPVELNCILQRYAYLLMKWNTDLDHRGKIRYFEKIFTILTIGIDKVLWNEDKKMWFDWDLMKNEHNVRFGPTNLFPLFTRSYDFKRKFEYGQHAVNYLIKEGIISSKYPHKPKYFIVPTSNDWTGELWDYPFGSPLLNAFVIEGLRSTGQISASRVALELAQRMVKTCYEGYTAHKTLFKEYDAIKPGSDRKTPGQEDPQFSESGYAPTNGAVLVLLNLYGHFLYSADDSNFIPMFNIIPL